MTARRAGATGAVGALLGLAVACSGSSSRPPVVPPEPPPLTTRIIDPNGEITVLAGDVVALGVVCSRGALEVEPDSVVWRSSVQGELSLAPSVDGVALLAGRHAITVEATAGDAEGSAQATIDAGYVGARIVRPLHGARLLPGTPVTLGAAAVGVEAGSLVQLVSSSTPAANQRTAQLWWQSSVGGFLGSADTLRVPSLAAGEHHLTLDLTYDDPEHGTVLARAAVDVVVDTPPEVGFDAPACDGTAVVEAGSALTLSAHASDVEDGALTGGFVDLLTGDSHTGDGWDFASAVTGEHLVRFEATDALDETTSAVCPVLVVPVGGGRADVFPPLDAVNAALPAGGDVRFVGGDGEGRRLVGVVGGLVVVDAGGTPSTLYGAAELGLAAAPTVGGGVVSGGRVVLGTTGGVIECDWVSGAPLGCATIDVHASAAVALDGDLAGSGVLAVASPLGLIVGAVDGGVLTTQFFARSSLSTGGAPYAVTFAGGVLFVATAGGLCVIRAPAALASPTAATPICDEVVKQSTSVLATSSLRALAVSGGGLWIGTTNGLGRYDLATGRTAHLGVGAGLVDPLIQALAVDPAGVLWVGTAGGLERLDPVTMRLMAVRPPEWSGSPEVRSLHVEGGRVWVGTSTGLRSYVGD